MSTEEIRTQVSTLFDIKKHGIASVFIAFGSTLLLILNLPESNIDRLKDVWYVPAFISTLLFIVIAFVGYITEQQNRTKIETMMVDRIDDLISKFDTFFVQQETRMNTFEDRLKSIYGAIEKRDGYTPGRDTEKFLHNQKEKNA